jgi:hypothetical protein
VLLDERDPRAPDLRRRLSASPGTPLRDRPKTGRGLRRRKDQHCTAQVDQSRREKQGIANHGHQCCRNGRSSTLHGRTWAAAQGKRGEANRAPRQRPAARRAAQSLQPSVSGLPSPFLSLFSGQNRQAKLFRKSTPLSCGNAAMPRSNIFGVRRFIFPPFFPLSPFFFLPAFFPPFPIRVSVPRRNPQVPPILQLTFPSVTYP